MRKARLHYDCRGLKTVGLVTGRAKGVEDQTLFLLYIPTSPNPTSGFTAVVPEHEVISTDMSVEDAMKLVISGGVVFPAELGKYASNGHLSSGEEVQWGEISSLTSPGVGPRLG